MFEHFFLVNSSGDDEIVLANKRPRKAARLVRAINFILVKNIFSPHLMNPKMMLMNLKLMPMMKKVLWLYQIPRFLCR